MKFTLVKTKQIDSNMQETGVNIAIAYGPDGMMLGMAAGEVAKFGEDPANAQNRGFIDHESAVAFVKKKVVELAIAPTLLNPQVEWEEIDKDARGNRIIPATMFPGEGPGEDVIVARIDNPDSVNLEISFTFTIGAWKKLLDQTKDPAANYGMPLVAIRGSVAEAIEEIEKQATEMFKVTDLML